jgi:hypothetical protein
VSSPDLSTLLTATVEQHDAAQLQERFVGLGLTPLGEMPLRRPVRVAGEILEIRTVPLADIPTIELVVSDGTAEVVAVFLGRRRIGGVAVGRGILLEGVAGPHGGRAAIWNPAYTLLPAG